MVGQTIAEKVFSEKVGQSASAGDYVIAPIDCAMLAEGFAAVWMHMQAAGWSRVWDRRKIVVVLDHYVPANTERVARYHKMMRDAVKKLNLPFFYGEGAGIGHQVLMEKGHARPGDLIVGADSHTCTYGALGAASTGIGFAEMAYVLAKGQLWFRVPESVRLVLKGRLPDRTTSKDILLAIAGQYGTEVAQYKSVEFIGDGADALSVESRMTMSNMAVEIGAKFGIFCADDKTRAYLHGRGERAVRRLEGDENARYLMTYEMDVRHLEPQVACPHSVGNVKPVGHVEGKPIHQAVLGSCTNGRLEDLRLAAEILRGRQVDPGVRLYVYPASRETYLRSIEENLLETLVEAGAIICNPCCGPCFGGHVGLMDAGEVCISSTNRNFRGRMGHPDADIYLASPATVAASALKGAIADPRKV
ncbi:MAG: 3-isopropylmalate dehydratase large subunit [bacterium]